MAADSPPPPPPPPPAPTTITALGDDILLEIFLCLPDITSLARAAFACRTFLHAVRSSPAFRRRFRQLRAPPLIALFLMPDMRTIVPADAGKGADIAAAFNGLLQDSDASKWWIDPGVSYLRGYANFFNPATDQRASYSPHSRTLKIRSKNIRYYDDKEAFLEFHTLPPDGEEKRPSRLVCVHRNRAWTWVRVAVFSSQTMQWQVVWPKTMEWQVVLPQTMEWQVVKLVDCNKYATSTVVNGFICWIHRGQGCILSLNTSTFKFSRMELPLLLKFSMYQLGHTKDGELCIVSVEQCMLHVWLWAANDAGVGRLRPHKTFSLRATVSKIVELSEEADVGMRPMAVINGFVYLSLYLRHPQHPYFRDPQSSEWFLSFCLETNEMNLLHRENQLLPCDADPYTMVSWPSSLINSKEDSETGVTGNIFEDGHMGTEEVSPVLFSALQSFKEKVIDDDNSNFAEIDSFLLDDERDSLVSRITTLESGLASARNCVLRIGTEPNSMSGMKLVTSESELTAARDRVLRMGIECNSIEG